MIKNIAFDLGGVVLALSYEQAVKRFETVLWTHTADMLATHVLDT